MSSDRCKLNEVHNVELPKLFSPKYSTDLVRVGNESDGGYILCQDDITECDFLISFGVHDDWSFEKEAFEKYGVKHVHAYDASVNRKYFKKNVLIWLIKASHRPWRLDFWKNFYNAIVKYKDYCNFFTENKIHYEKYVGTALYWHDFITLDDIMKTKVFTHEKIFLKMDIEGGEYRILETIIKYAKYLSGLAIEFHNVDVHLATIESFLKELPLNLVHTHANNGGGVMCLSNGRHIPSVVEMTFSSREVGASVSENDLPLKLDRKNVNDLPDLKISFY